MIDIIKVRALKSGNIFEKHQEYYFQKTNERSFTTEIMINGQIYERVENIDALYNKTKSAHFKYDDVLEAEIMNYEILEVSDKDGVSLIIYETCSVCLTEIEIKDCQPKICSNCGDLVLPCKLCDLDNVNCNKCPWEK
jgi:exosome complex RNA-binding protein Csl4